MLYIVLVTLVTVLAGLCLYLGVRLEYLYGKTTKGITLATTDDRIMLSRYKMNMALQTGGLCTWEYDIETRKYSAIFSDHVESGCLDNGTNEQLIHPDDRQRYFDLVKRSTESAGPRVCTIRYRTSPESDYRYTEVTISTVFDANQRPTHMFGVYHDVHELHALNENLRQSLKREAAANHLKSAFLANMSHEIRTPLNAIVGFSGLIADTEDRAEIESYHKRIAENSSRLLQLIDNILNLSQIESGCARFCDHPFDIRVVVDEIAAGYRPKLAAGVELRTEYPDAVTELNLDRNRIYQVLSLLTDNAMKFTTKGHITIGYRFVDHGVELYVEDTGIGIPQAEQQRIFDRFVQLDEFETGTGLGLSICKAIVETRGGNISVESEPGKGSTFRTWIPYPMKSTDVSSFNKA